MKNITLPVLILLSSLPAFGQCVGTAWAASAVNAAATIPAGEINQKMAYQACAGTPTANSLNGTVGHDVAVNTTNNDLYIPSVTGTPATWVKVGSILGGSGAINLASGGGGTTISCQNATAGQFGCVEVDGSTITASGGVISAAAPSGVSTLTVANAASTGTTVHTLTSYVGAATAVITTAAATGGVIGVTTAGAGTSGSATIQINGVATCVFDGATTQDHYVTISTSVNGNCHDTGATYPTGTQAIGRVLSTNGGGGTYSIYIFPSEIQSSTGTTAFNSLSSGTNTTMAALVGAGATLGTTSTGTIQATSVTGLSVTASKTLTASNSITLAGTDSTTMTFPSTSATIAQTIASGTSAMGTGAISSGACATVVTTTATGAATTDVIAYTPNTDPTAVTGYGPSASGSLYIWAYPSSGNVNFKVCNNTSGSITPSALTLNWRVGR